MIRYPLVRAVAAPDLDAEVLYDFCDATLPGVETYVERDGFSIGVPQLLGDPDALGVEWGLRQLKVPQVIEGSKGAALACQSRLARVLMRRRYWVMVQLDATTTPVWWHAYRSQPGEVSFDSVYVDEYDTIVAPGTPDAEPLPDMWQIVVQVDADPFGCLERRTLPPVLIGNDPAGTPPASGIALSDLAGDAVTGLRVTVGPAVATENNEKWLVACVSSARPSPVIRVPIGEGDGFAASNGTSAPAPRTSAWGGSCRIVDFAAGGSPVTTPLSRLDGFIPDDTAPRGRYMLLLRCAVTTPAPTRVTFDVSHARGALVRPIFPTVSVVFPTSGGTDNYQVVPLGEISIDDALPDDVPGAGLTAANLHMGADNPAADAILDEFILVPLAGPDVDLVTWLVLDSYDAKPSTTRPLVVDADTEAAWISDLNPGWSYELPTTGGYPAADPGSTHVVLFAAPLSSTQSSPGRGTTIGATADLEVSYHPRVLWLGDGQPAGDA